MNKKQWYIFAIGFFIFGLGLMSISGSYCNAVVLSETEMISCFIRRYAYSIPGLIFGFLGLLFFICGLVENKK